VSVGAGLFGAATEESPAPWVASSCAHAWSRAATGIKIISKLANPRKKFPIFIITPLPGGRNVRPQRTSI
jgi:hypothetical protein